MVDMTNDVARFETIFADRFTGKDCTFMELKSKSLSQPVVIHPWKTQRKQWNKRWDYTSRQNQGDRSQRDGDDRYRQSSYDRYRQSSYDRYRNRSEGEGNSRGGYRDREDREHSRDRCDYFQGGHRSRKDERNWRDKHANSQDGQRPREKKLDFQAALKAYSER